MRFILGVRKVCGKVHGRCAGGAQKVMGTKR